jgi:hypothetical protein
MRVIVERHMILKVSQQAHSLVTRSGQAGIVRDSQLPKFSILRIETVGKQVISLSIELRRQLDSRQESQTAATDQICCLGKTPQ